jgi:hypothetical protein
MKLDLELVSFLFKSQFNSHIRGLKATTMTTISYVPEENFLMRFNDDTPDGTETLVDDYAETAAEDSAETEEEDSAETEEEDSAEAESATEEEDSSKATKRLVDDFTETASNNDSQEEPIAPPFKKLRRDFVLRCCNCKIVLPKDWPSQLCYSGCNDFVADDDEINSW